MIMFICDRFIWGPSGLASLQCILCSWLSQNSFWNLWRFQGDSLSTLRVVVSYTILYKGKLEKIYDKNVFACKLIAVFCPVGEEVKSIFMASGLPQQVLAHIW